MSTNGQDVNVHDVELVEISELRPHPQNYREHPDDQRDHIVRSMREHGFYRNVIVARDGTIIAGHGVVAAAQELGLTRVPAVRLDIEPRSVEALRILTGDNEIARLAIVDDRMLTELLREIRELDIDGLIGTGFDDAMLANLVYVTRPETEIRNRWDAAFWVGMPAYEQMDRPLRLVVSFETEEARTEFCGMIELDGKISQRERTTWSCWWPPREQDDTNNLRFEEEPEEE